jgi:hypothetical protein
MVVCPAGISVLRRGWDAAQRVVVATWSVATIGQIV